jgi:hypothetical protein
MNSVQAMASINYKRAAKPVVIAKKKPMAFKLVRKNSAPATVTDEDVRGARNCLLHGVRATGIGLGVLTIEDEHFADMVEHDEDYRAMILEMVKVMQVQKGYDATCAELAEKALKKMTKALVAFGDFSTVEEAFQKPVDYSKIPAMEAAIFDGVNDLQSIWLDVDV